MQKLIITVALTGNVPTRALNPHLPVTSDEIASDVKRCREAGASVFHLHARDADQQPTLDISVIKENVRKTKAIVPDAILQLSTGARAGKDRAQRGAPVRLLPEMASFTTGSNNMPNMVYENSPQFIEYLARIFQETGLYYERRCFLESRNP